MLLWELQTSAQFTPALVCLFFNWFVRMIRTLFIFVYLHLFCLGLEVEILVNLEELHGLAHVWELQRNARLGR